MVSPGKMALKTGSYIKPLASFNFLFIFPEKMFVKCQINATFAVRFPKGLPRRSENQLLNKK
jgi:hypothetical protein